MKDRLFGDKPFYKKLWELTLPIAFQSLMLSLVAAADAFMLGGIEQNAMSAVSLASQIQFVQNMILSACVSVTGILGAQYWGKKDVKSMNDIFCLSLRLCGVVSVLFFIGCEFFPGALMKLFTNEEVLIEIGIRYLKIAGWSYLLTGISQCYLTMMKVSENASATAKISSAAVIINILLNAVFIFGLFGCKAMGVQGAALATLIARAIECAASVLVSFRDGFLRPRLIGLFRRNRVLSKDYYVNLLPVLGSCLIWSVGFTSYTAFIGHMGVDAAAANSVASVIRELLCCLCNGLSSAGGIMVGNELGAGDLEKGRLYGDRIAKLAFICGFLSSAVMFIVTPLVMKLVKLSPGAHAYMLQMMIIMSVYMIGRAVNTIIINGIFYSGGDSFFDFYSLIACMWCLAIPLAALGTFVFHWPVWIVYSCTCLDEVGKIPWVMVHFKKYKWVRNLTRDVQAEA